MVIGKDFKSSDLILSFRSCASKLSTWMVDMTLAFLAVPAPSGNKMSIMVHTHKLNRKYLTENSLTNTTKPYAASSNQIDYPNRQLESKTHNYVLPQLNSTPLRARSGQQWIQKKPRPAAQRFPPLKKVQSEHRHNTTEKGVNLPENRNATQNRPRNANNPIQHTHIVHYNHDV